MLTQLLIYFFIMSLLFFGTAFMCQKKYRLQVVIMNILYLGFVYFSVFQLLGSPIPLEYNLYGINNIIHSDKFILQNAIVTDNLTYLTIYFDNTFKFFSIKTTPEFTAKLKKALSLNNGQYGFKIDLNAIKASGYNKDKESVDTKYDSAAASNISMGQFQKNTNISKPDVNDDSNSTVKEVEVH